MKNLRISPAGVGDFIASNYFSVPMFQRSYAWTTTQVRNLLIDLTAAVKRKKDGKTETYFLGSIVVVEKAGSDILDVVDGQQRLATISIILAAIRDYHWAIGSDRAAEVYDQKYLRAFIPGGKPSAKLRLNEIDDRCYAQAILEHPSKRKVVAWPATSHRKLLAAYQYAKEHVASIEKLNSRKEAVAVLFEFAEYIRTNVQVIRVGVDDEADAFTVFETLNDRHLPLTVADLLKNFLFSSVGKAGLEEAKGNWRQMLGSLQVIKGKRDRIVDFIRQLWGSMHGLVRQKDLFREIKGTILDETSAAELSAALADQAANYAAVLNPASKSWTKHGPQAVDAIATFNALRVERLRPLLLAILDRFDASEIKKALSYLRSASVRLVVTNGINGTVEEKIYELAQKVHSRQIKRTSQLMRVMKDHVPNDKVFEAHFATMFVTKSNLARFYLCELEEVAKGDTDPNRDVSRDERRVTLEHIIPKAAGERAEHWSELSEELGAELSRRFGNLTLLNTGPNSRLNGKPYAQKKQAYEESEGIYITKQIARDYAVWGEKQVNDRQEKLARLAVLRWTITAQSGRQKR